MKHRLAVHTLKSTVFDFEGNSEKIKSSLSGQNHPEPTLHLFPELAISGYGCEDAFFRDDILELTWATVRELSKSLKARDLLVVGGAFRPQKYPRPYNCMFVLRKDAVVGIYPKKHLANSGVYYESRWFDPWESGKCLQLSQGDKQFAFGDFTLNWLGLSVGFELCEEAWVQDRPANRLAKTGVDLILNSSASHFALGKIKQRDQIFQNGADCTGAVYAFSNLLGNESGRLIFDGASAIYFPNSGASAASPPLQMPPLQLVEPQPLTLLVANRSPSLSADASLVNAQSHQLKPNEKKTSKVDVKLAILATHSKTDGTENAHSDTLPTASPTQTQISMRSNESPTIVDPFVEFELATTLALWDLIQKTRASGVIISLSGGVDSCVTAYLAWRTLARARELELTKLSPSAFVTCVYQKTDQSSARTRELSQEFSKFYSFEHIEWDVQPLVNGYEALVSTAIQKTLSWSEFDLAKQNIQSRSRSPGVWMLANSLNRILLTTSNRSEVGVGYCTMDGDTSGGYGLLSGVSKTFLIEYCEHLARSGESIFEKVLRGAPSAELRPLTDNQTDEADLMPYRLLQEIERLFVEERLSPTETLNRLLASQGARTSFGQMSPAELTEAVNRFFRLFTQSQWKRERYAPAPHLDAYSLDPKTWLRWPILSANSWHLSKTLPKDPEPKS